MSIPQRLKQGRHRKGGATVELAIILPFLLTLILGTVEASRALHVQQVLSDGCRASGRLAIQSRTTVADVTASAKKILECNDLPPGTVTVTVTVNGKKTTDLSTAREGDRIGVTISISAASVGYVSPYFLSTDAMLTATIVMRRQK